MDRGAFLMRYFQPKSLTWWAGVCAFLLGLLLLTGEFQQLDQIARVLAVLLGGGDASPAGLILLGLGLIGVRDKLERLAK